MTGNYASLNRVLVFAGLCVTLVIVLLPLAAQAAPAAIPPVPTRPPTPTPTPIASASAQAAPPDGSRIELRVKFSDTWPEVGMQWQDLWTVVQWRDDRGYWHNVEGWQGTLDEVQDGVGEKVWWVAEADLGKGPFRWLVYQERDGRLLVASDSFYLPSDVGRVALVEVAVLPW